MVEDVRAEPFDIPGYRIVRWLGRGGMADVYLAIQLSLGRPVAIKVLATERAPSDDLVSRFEQEARIIARLDHPHIVGIFDVGRTSTGQLYYTMPHMPNGHLAARDLTHDQNAVVEVIRAICHALAYAHEQGIVHRDVKPENVLFDKLSRPLLADFGIAISNVGQIRVTREGATLGSVAYMSPEQARGRPLDGRSDIYSLGVVCYECLTGKLPFSGEDSMSVALAHVEQPVPHLPPARKHWQSFVEKAMAKKPDDRFQAAQEMLDALDAVEKRIAFLAPIAAAATTLASMPERLERRFNVPVLSRLTRAIAIVVLGVSVLVIALTYQFRTPKSQDIAARLGTGDGAKRADSNTDPVLLSHLAPVAGAVSEPATPASDGVATSTESSSTPTTESPAQSPPPAGAVIHDPGGPETIVVPAQLVYGGNTHNIAHAFALGRYEVTRGEYAEFARAAGRPNAPCRETVRLLSVFERVDWRNPGFTQDDRHPVVCVSWEDASAYVQWLSKRMHHHYRLPSQSEWLQAARSASEGGAVCKYGNVADQSNHSFLHLSSRYNCNDGFAQTAPVGRFLPGKLGIHDLIGNVSEWTRDCAPRNGGSKANESSRCQERIYRGISWRDGPGSHNLEFSESAKTDVGYTTVGFRVAREIETDDQFENPATSTN